MEQRLRQLREQLVRLLDGFTTGQKAILGVAVAAVLVGGFLFTSWASKPSYTALYTNLDTSDAAAITEALTAEGVSYQLADGGSTVMVPRNKLYDLRLDLSAQGLPAGGEEGFKMLDDQGITASEFRQRVDFQRALSGELAKTIEAMRKVDDATVQLVIPKDDLFADDDVKSTASVLLVPSRGATFSATEVESVVHLVAASVEGLTPENVTVTDDAGNLLSAAGPEGQAALQGDRRAQQTVEFEQRVSDRVQQQLESVLGAGNARVSVAAELDFDKRHTTTENFTEGVPLAQSEANENFTGTSEPVGGPLGEAEVPVQPGENNTYEKTENSTTFANNKITEILETAPGAVDRMAISVFVNSNAGVAIPAAELEQQVTAAAGLDAARGDTVQVSLVAFDDSAAADAEEARQAALADARREDLLATARTVATLLFVGIGLLIGYRRMRGGRREELIDLEQLALAAGPTTAEAQLDGGYDEDELYELTEEELMELEPAQAAAALAAGGRMGPAVAYEDDEGPAAVLRSRRQATQLDRLPGMEEREAAHADIADLIDRQPDDVAQLLRSWMAEMRRTR